MKKVIIPIGNFQLTCPKCGSQTHYKRKGYDGELGEGQYCGKCKKFIIEMIQRSFPMFVSCEEDKISTLHEKLQKEVDKHYKTTIKTENIGGSS